MICPCCDTINKDEAKVCRNCGIPLAGRKTRPEDAEREKNYLKVGIASVAALIIFLSLFFGLASCICSGCVEKDAGENVINEDVEGTYFDDTVSESDYLISSEDLSGIDEPSEDVPAE